MRKWQFFAWLSAALMFVSMSASAQVTTSYTYDDQGRLKSVTPPSGSNTNYCYDNADNRTAMQTAPGSTGCASNHAPVCPSYTVNINPPTSSPVVISIPFGSGCTDADGDTLTLTSPASTNVTVYIHTTTYYNYTMSDGHGGTGSGLVTVVRP